MTDDIASPRPGIDAVEGFSRHVHVAGVGMTRFCRPHADWSYAREAAQAARQALRDAGLAYDDLDQAFVGYVYADSTAGQRVLYDIGMSGLPIVNVNNNCATGSSALYLARQAVASGAADCVLALGFEQMRPGSLAAVFPDMASPLERFDLVANQAVGHDELPLALRYFGGAGLEHMRRFGTALSTFAAIRAKASRHAAHNPHAIFRQPLSVQDVLDSAVLWPDVMTRLMACPPTCGAAAAVVCSERFARTRGLDGRVRIAAQVLATDRTDTFATHDMRDLVGFGMARRTARAVYEQAGVDPADVDVVELHDCFAQNELLSYEALGLCEEGEGERFVLNGDNTYGGKVVTNPSGGLLSKGHPLGATGLAQCCELVWQLRGQAGERQVEDARLAVQHNLGLGGACVVTLYERGCW
ncbi:acetyl-CoA acetyltransferase [Pseudacidovorax intermedius]|uniref:propanoyl-CoA C-acyltransferase n=1 Tax=Pseudacidovorax intermedius TaxID=433924 RepID=A0A370FDN5_9BURK|nr:lipid-transfer protein [Pseudacidovorax intermedius]RDI23545.1 acetyl-CoA acetyltransferase [Pseudacidovorax intermedius]